MSKYYIHACPDRMWYVDGYLVPSIKEQGIENIIVKCDYERVGNLKSCMNIFESIGEGGGSWHLQDDVVICRDFKKRTEEIDNYIVCGFVIKHDNNISYEGLVPPEKMWWSFPCIYIPNMIARDCAHWVNERAKMIAMYSWMAMSGKNDDYLFREFLKLYYPNQKIINLKPNLVDHVDYLLGGTTVNHQRKNKDVRAAYFEDIDLVEELEKKIGSNNG